MGGEEIPEGDNEGWKVTAFPVLLLLLLLFVATDSASPVVATYILGIIQMYGGKHK